MKKLNIAIAAASAMLLSSGVMADVKPVNIQVFGGKGLNLGVIATDQSCKKGRTVCDLPLKKEGTTGRYSQFIQKNIMNKVTDYAEPEGDKYASLIVNSITFDLSTTKITTGMVEDEVSSVLIYHNRDAELCNNEVNNNYILIGNINGYVLCFSQNGHDPYK